MSSYIFPIISTLDEVLAIEPLAYVRHDYTELGLKVLWLSDFFDRQNALHREIAKGLGFSAETGEIICRPRHRHPAIDEFTDSRIEDLITYGDFTIQPSNLKGTIICGLPVAGGFRLICPGRGVIPESLAAEAWLNDDKKRRDKYVWELNKLRVEGATATFIWTDSLLLICVRDNTTGEYWPDDSLIFSRLPYLTPSPSPFALQNLTAVEWCSPGIYTPDFACYAMRFLHTDHIVEIWTNGEYYFVRR